MNVARKKCIEDADALLVYYGDILSDIDLRAMVRQHLESNALATLAVAKGFEVPVGVPEIEGITIKSWVEKPKIDIYAGIGIVALCSDIFRLLEELSKGRKMLDIWET